MIFNAIKNKLSRRIKKVRSYLDKPAFKIKNSDDIKKPDILFVFCPPWDVYMPPLGISYLSSVLNKANFKTLIFDINIQLFNKSAREYKEFWKPEKYDYWVDKKLFGKIKEQFKEEIEEAVDRIIDTHSRVIGFSVHMSNRLFAIEVARLIKQKAKDKLIIFGGYGCSNEQMRSEIPEAICDIFVVGEGEDTILEILSRIRDDLDLKDIKGAIAENANILEHREPIKDLSTIAFPTYNEYFLDSYIDPTLPLLLSRGCIGRCTFCNDHVLARPFRVRDAEDVFKEILYHFRNKGVASYSFKDLLCNGDSGNLERLCDLIIAEGLELTWDSQAIPKKDMTLQLLKKMKRAGCHTLIYGIESFSNRVLRKMGKYFSAEDAIEVLKSTKMAGIRTLINIIVGFPGETDEDFMLTYNAIRNNNAHVDMFSSLNTCCVNADCDLDANHTEYDITLPGDPFERALKWYANSNDNTYEIRKERALKLLDLLDELGISYMCTNAKQENKSVDWKKRMSDKNIERNYQLT